MNASFSRKTRLVLAFLLCAAASPGFAAQQAQGLVQGIGSDSESDTASGSNLVRNRPPASFVDRFLTGVRRGTGFSVGLVESYDPGVDTNQTQQTSTHYTSVQPRFFIMSEGPRSELKFDYLFGYRRYHGQSSLNSSTHAGEITYGYQASPNVRLSLGSGFQSSFNDRGLAVGTFAALGDQVNFDQALYFARTRLTTAQVRGSVDYRAGKKMTVTVTPTYDFWRYHLSGVGDTHAFQVQLKSGYQLNRFMTFETTYSHYLNSVPASYRPVNIQKFQVGGLSLKSRRGWGLSVGAGAESANQQGVRQTSASGSMTVSKTSGSTDMALTYHRGFSTAVGSGVVLGGNNLSANFNRWLGNQVSLRINSGYTQGASIADQKLSSLTGTAQLEVAVSRHVVVSGQYDYISQRTTNIGTVPYLNRSSASVGLQFFFSPLSRR